MPAVTTKEKIFQKSNKTIDKMLGNSSHSEDFDGDSSSDDTFRNSSAVVSLNNKAKEKKIAPPTAKRRPVAAESLTTGNTVSKDDSYTVVLPSSWVATGNPPPGDCSLLIQVEPDDAARLDYEGTSGAMGRLEAGDSGIILDFKGRQYQASILPGPTSMLVGLYKGAQLKVEGITDEFGTLTAEKDVMATLDAIVTGEMDEGYKFVDGNVNRTDRSKGDAGEESGASANAAFRKRKSPYTKDASSKPVAKRKKKAN